MALPSLGLDAKRRLRAAGLVAVVLLACVGLLASGVRSEDLGASELWQMRSPTAWLPRLFDRVAFRTLLFAGLSAPIVLLFPDRPSRTERLLHVALPALAAATLAALAALQAQHQLRAGVAASDFFACPLGLLFGVVFGLAARRGLRVSVLTSVAIVGLAAAALLGLVGLALFSLEREAAVSAPSAIRTSDKRQLAALVRAADPRKIADGETYTLRIEQVDVDHLLAWGLPIASRVGRARAALRLEGTDTVALDGSLRVPRVERWLNIHASAETGVVRGRPFLRHLRLGTGKLHLPGPLTDLLGRAIAFALERDQRLGPVLAGVTEARIDSGAATFRYGHMNLPHQVMASILWGEVDSAKLRASVSAQMDILVDALRAAPKGDDRFARAYEAAFKLARARTPQSSAIEENRGAIMGLAIVLGSVRLSLLGGPEAVESARAREIAALRADTTVRGRSDWTRHFSISGALTVMSSVAPSDAAGLLKEELDADGGSGFSFGDLLADRAGTTFGDVATRDEATAAAWQDRIAHGFDIADYFPPAADLPEGIPDPELRQRYGGVGGPLYQQFADEIERRVAACPAYRAPRAALPGPTSR